MARAAPDDAKEPRAETAVINVAPAPRDEAERYAAFRSVVDAVDLGDRQTVEGLLLWADHFDMPAPVVGVLREIASSETVTSEQKEQLWASISVGLAVPNDREMASAPGADTCAAAIALSFPFGDSTVTNDTATADADISCNGALANAPFGIWYTFTPAVNSILRMGETGSGQDIFWTLYSGGCGGLVEVACFSADTNQVSPVLTGTTQYWVLISKSNSTASTTRLAVNFDLAANPPAPPANDACAAAAPVGSLPATVPGSVFFSTDDAESTPVCGTGSVNQAVWYSVVGTGNLMTATTCDTGTAFDTKVQVWTGACGALTCIGGNDDQPGSFVAACGSTGSTTLNRASTVTWCSEVGQTYLIAVGGFGAEVGSFVLHVNDGGPCHGACCIGPPFACSVLTSTACTAAGGFYLGDGYPCILDGYDACDCDDNNVLDRAERITVPKNFFFSFDPPLPIPDNNATGVMDVHTIEAECGLLFDVNIGVDITHPFDGDLDIFLMYEDMVNPPITVELSTDNGGTGDNYTDTIFDSEAATPITAGAPPFTGSFRPEGSLAVLYNKEKCARWTLIVIDDAAADVGVVNDWSILFTNAVDDCNENLVPDKCEPSEACCFPDNTCDETIAECCTDDGGVPEGPGTVCTEIQACCLPTDSSCIDVDPLCCLDLDGIPQGPGTMCTGLQACCLPDTSCADLDPLCCEELGGIPEGAGTACTELQACCLADSTCIDIDPLCCEDRGGTPEGAGTVCSPPRACCLPDGTCENLDPLCCEDRGGTSELPGALCTAPQACCLPNGTCSSLDPLCCENIGGTPRGPGSACDGIQACCMANGTCTDIDAECCVAQGGTPRGPGSACDGIQACCMANGTCTDIDAECCVAQGGTPRGPGSACDGVQACCMANGTCSNIDAECCVAQGGAPRGPGSACDGIQACCMANGTCSEIDAECCVAQGGVPRGPGSTCDGVQACCRPDGSCSNIDAECCVAQGGTPRGPGSACDGVQACCLPNGTCSNIDAECCVAQGGTPRGPGSSCDGVQACCRADGSCSNIDGECCLAQGGTPEGSGTSCSAPVACCLPDDTCVELDTLCCIDRGGSPQGGGSVCSGPQACVMGEECVDLDPACCVDDGGTPTGGDCGEPGGCCFSDGTCQELDPAVCIVLGGSPLAPGFHCQGDADGNGTDDACEDVGIPTVSTWGLAVLTLLLLTGWKVYFGRRAVGAGKLA